MTPGPRRRAWVVLAFLLSAAFALLAHAALVHGLPPVLGAALSLVPLALVAAWWLRRSAHRGAALGAVALAALAIAFGWTHVERHFASLLFVEHAGINLLLAVLFGRTLRAGREPLVTRFARLVHGSVTPELARYTRRVTVAWTALFVAIFALSCALRAAGEIAAWSLLANVASPLLVVAMFVGEYAVRLRALPEVERVGILGGIRAFSRHFAARADAPR